LRRELRCLLDLLRRRLRLVQRRCLSRDLVLGFGRLPVHVVRRLGQHVGRALQRLDRVPQIEELEHVVDTGQKQTHFVA
jgi:hypothetical protein